MSFSLPFNPFLTHTTSVAYCSTPLSLSLSVAASLTPSLALVFALIRSRAGCARSRSENTWLCQLHAFLLLISVPRFKEENGCVLWGGNWTRNHQQHAPNSCVDHKTTHVHCGKLQAVTCAIWYAMRCSALLAMCFVEVLYQKGLV